MWNYEEWMQLMKQKFPVLVVRGFVKKYFVTGVETPIFEKVLTHTGLKFKIPECKYFNSTELTFCKQTYISISDMLCSNCYGNI
jgi:hypothetical protein